MSDDKNRPDAGKIRQKEKVASVRAARGKGLAQSEVLGSGPANRHGMPRLPPGQRAVKDWPVLDLGIHPQIDKKDWRLEVAGLCEQPGSFSWDDLMAWEQVEQEADFHCVTTWSLFDSRWGGVRLAHLLRDVCRVKAEAKFVLFTGYDDYTTNLPLSEALKDDVMLVHSWQGQDLAREHGGPCRIITPQLYAWKGAKWVRRIELLAEDQLGFWEERGYSNTAEPWHDDRYSGEGPPPETVPAPKV